MELTDGILEAIIPDMKPNSVTAAAERLQLLLPWLNGDVDDSAGRIAG